MEEFTWEEKSRPIRTEPKFKNSVELAFVNDLKIKCYVEWSDKIIDDYDEDSGEVEYKEGWMLKPIPNQVFLYQGQPYMGLGTLFNYINKQNTMEELINKVIEWGEPKGLTESRPMLKSWPQYEKVQEEAQEIARALVNNDKDGLVDGIGDTMVTLILLAKQNDLDIQDCLEYAYNEIKGRTGKTINGKFVKDS